MREEDSSLFDTAIDWYVNGNRSTNIFHRFLSYYIALEGLAIPFIKGKMEVSKKHGVEKTSKKKKESEIKNCILKKHKSLYKINPVKFINESYSECVLGLRTLTREALQKVFGVNHKFISLFFKKIDGYSLYDLRNKLAHGVFSLIDPENQETIKKRLEDLQVITHEFIMRLSMRIKPEESYKKFNRFSLSIFTNDPRSTGVCSSLELIPNKDWKIKLEWLI